MKKDKIFGIVSLCVSAIVTTLVTDWMTRKEIESKFEEVYAEKLEKNEEES